MSYQRHPDRLRDEERIMKIKNLLKTKLLPVTAGAAVVALAAGGVAYASTPSMTPSSATTTSVAAASSTAKAGILRADVRRLARHTIHANLIVHTKKGFESVTIDKGRLTADSSAT